MADFWGFSQSPIALVGRARIVIAVAVCKSKIQKHLSECVFWDHLKLNKFCEIVVYFILTNFKEYILTKLCQYVFEQMGSIQHLIEQIHLK